MNSFNDLTPGGVSGDNFLNVQNAKVWLAALLFKLTEIGVHSLLSKLMLIRLNIDVSPIELGSLHEAPYSKSQWAIHPLSAAT